MRRARRAAVLLNSVTVRRPAGGGRLGAMAGLAERELARILVRALLRLVRPSSAMLGPSVNVLPMLRRDGEVAQALRRAAASGDERVAPLASGQPGTRADAPRAAAVAPSLRIRSSAGSRRLTEKPVMPLWLQPTRMKGLAWLQPRASSLEILAFLW